MPAARPLLHVGLTGGIASGKTTVARMLAGHGAFVLDADGVVHDLLRPGTPVFEAVVARFGGELMDGAGRLDRARLGRVVFRDGEARRALEAIVHPALLSEVERRFAEYAVSGRSPIAVLDAALVVETGLWRRFHRLIVVRCSAAVQRRRLLVRDRLSPAEVEARIAAQAPLSDKLALADYVVDTGGTLRETEQRVAGVWAALSVDVDRELGG